MKRSNERLIQLARSVNDDVVGAHIGQLCRDMADRIEVMSHAAKGALDVANKAMALRRISEQKAVALECMLRVMQKQITEGDQP